jgi:hypothetical protein
MGILKDQAETLRALANRIEQVGDKIGNTSKPSAKALALRYAPQDCLLTYRQVLNLEHMQGDLEGYVRYAVKVAGHTFGETICKKLHAEYKGVLRSAPGSFGYTGDTATYEVNVAVMSPAELEKVVAAAYDAGVLDGLLR